MKAIKKILAYTGTIYHLNRDTKRAWAEYFEMERRIVRQKFLTRLYGTLLLGFLFGLIIDKLS